MTTRVNTKYSTRDSIIRTRYPVYMCVAVPEAENSIAGHYEAWPFGMCQKFIRVSDNVDPLEYVTTMPVVSIKNRMIYLTYQK